MGNFPIRYLLLLALPAFYPLGHSLYAAWSQGLVPTGFVQYDLPYYLANAREHFDHGWRWMYGNPYAPLGTPGIYFQPHIFVLALLQAAGLPPAWALHLFGVFAVALASYAALRLYAELVGVETRGQRLGFLCFFWGGGVLSLLGLLFGKLAGFPLAKALFAFDPNDGWWMLNFGRNLIYPTEAYYHGVFLLAIYFLLRHRFGAALALTALLSASHPFTGLSLALIVASYAALELIERSGAATWRLALGAGAIVTAHVLYYLVYLSRAADHRLLRSQWEIDWPYTAWTYGPALYLVGFLALTRFTRWASAWAILTDPRSRLLLVWFAVVFGLTQHDVLVKPMQPIHFAHGYDWIALFFLAAPVLIPLLERLRPIPLAVCVLLLLSDNLLWFASFASAEVQRYAIALTPAEDETLQWLRREGKSTDLIAADDPQINYLTSTYSAARTWHGHVHNTPQTKLRQTQIDTLQFPAPGPNLFILRDASRAPAGTQLIQHFGEFQVFRRNP
ncbi:MAG: hypothetical protein K2X03_00510 [Bryobacteraceae bacterium]|nr:hypothetical protein [Bryobacteraceae bacterium]